LEEAEKQGAGTLGMTRGDLPGLPLCLCFSPILEVEKWQVRDADRWEQARTPKRSEPLGQRTRKGSSRTDPSSSTSCSSHPHPQQRLGWESPAFIRLYRAPQTLGGNMSRLMVPVQAMGVSSEEWSHPWVSAVL
jgi:hypothetical protein